MLAQVVAFDDLAERFLAAGVGVCGVEVVDAAFERREDCELRALHVDAGDPARETHAPHAEDRELVPRLLVQPVFHGSSTVVCFGFSISGCGAKADCNRTLLHGRHLAGRVGAAPPRG